jgi:hypothetical protein
MRLASMSPEELKAENSYALCNALNNNSDNEVRAELERRGQLSDEEWKLIDTGYIQVGMSELALICLKGGIIPGVNGYINTTTGSYGVHKQYVYENAFGGRYYVYVENGKVSGWQN